jgi:hypothetical protein|tara:strand:- start:476 stop:754 length:279 start_codon:yes stop_codon:yes gene_type:complete
MLHVAIDSELTGLPERAKPSEEEDRMNDMKKLIEIMALALEIWIERMENYIAWEKEEEQKEEQKEAENAEWEKLESETAGFDFKADFRYYYI